MNESARRINYLGQHLGHRTYLELGVNHGLTFKDVKLRHRVAVDPVFNFNVTEIENENTSFHQVSSDEYFSVTAIDINFDVIFVDGLHKFEQVIRDLSNAIIHSHGKSVILLDDTKPDDIFSSLRDPSKTMQLRRSQGLVGQSWHGDVFKSVFYIHDFWPALNYRTIVGSGNPQTLVWREAGYRKPRFNSLEAISRLTYPELLDNLDMLREADEETALKLCVSEISGARCIPFT